MTLATPKGQPDHKTTAALSVVTELAARFSAGDAAGAAALFHPGIRVQQPQTLPHGGWHEGMTGMAEMGARFGEHWTRTIGSPRIFGGPGQDATITQVTTQTWTAKATGRSAMVDVVELFQVRDGQVTEIRVFQQDTALLLSTLP
jgi:ketosteroid isomerase-like protein